MIGGLICFLAMFGLQLITPFWWWIMVVPFAYGALQRGSEWSAFRSGAFSAGLLWLLAGTYQWRTGGEIITRRVAEMFTLGSAWQLLGVTVLIAMLAAGLAATTGHLLRAALRKA